MIVDWLDRMPLPFVQPELNAVAYMAAALAIFALAAWLLRFK